MRSDITDSLSTQHPIIIIFLTFMHNAVERKIRIGKITEKSNWFVRNSIFWLEDGMSPGARD